MNDERRLWVVSELYYPEQTSTGYFLTHIAEGLAHDFDVRVIAGQPGYSERTEKAPVQESRNRVFVRRVWATQFDKNRLLFRAINNLTFTLSVLFAALIRFRKGDQVLVVTNPPALPLCISIAAKVRGVRSYLLVHDVYPEILAATGLLKANSSTYRILKKVMQRAFDAFEQVIVLGRDMADIVANKLKEPSRITVIPNWADVDEVKPIAKADNAFRREHGLDGKFVIQFSGNIGRSHDIELVLDAARRLQDRADIAFVFIGGGGGASPLATDTVRTMHNVTVLPRQSRERLPSMLASSDATIISFVDGMLGLSVPSRMYNIMAAGVPIIASAHPSSELAKVVTEGKAGWVLPDRNVNTLVSLIREAASAGNTEPAQRGSNGRELVESMYSVQKVVASFKSVLSGGSSLYEPTSK